MQRYDDFIWQWCQIKHVMRNGAKWCEMMLFDCIISQLIVKGLSKNHLISLVLMNLFSKTHQSSLTLKGGSTSHLGLLPSGKKRKPPYSVLKPLRYKVGGPSEVYASSGAAVFCAGWTARTHDAGCLLDADGTAWIRWRMLDADCSQLAGFTADGNRRDMGIAAYGNVGRWHLANALAST